MLDRSLDVALEGFRNFAVFPRVLFYRVSRLLPLTRSVHTEPAVTSCN